MGSRLWDDYDSEDCSHRTLTQALSHNVETCTRFSQLDDPHALKLPADDPKDPESAKNPKNPESTRSSGF